MYITVEEYENELREYTGGKNYNRDKDRPGVDPQEITATYKETTANRIKALLDNISSDELSKRRDELKF
jgi:hypothetical protein